MNVRGHLFLLIGPSGSGKTSIIREITARRPSIRFIPTTTTRPPRPGERNGREYFFVTDDEFDQAISRGEFLEWKQIHGYRYGTSRSRLEEAVRSGVIGIMSVDITGGLEIKRFFGSAATTIFVRPRSTEDLLVRLAGRGDSQEDIERRMQRALRELQMADHCDAVVVNEQGRLEEAVEAVLAIIDRTIKPATIIHHNPSE